jgi:hypothetical protein
MEQAQMVPGLELALKVQELMEQRELQQFRQSSIPGQRECGLRW